MATCRHADAIPKTPENPSSSSSMSTTFIAGREVTIGEPSFDDGNVILVTVEEPTAFRLHRGVLARHSDVFEDMFEVAGPTVDGTLSDTPQAVPMYDNPSDLSSLIKALYDGVTSDPTDPTDFFQLAGVLRLSTKYFANRIRSQVIQLLLKTWTSTLEGHDEMVKKALAAPVVNNLTYPYVHPLHVLNLAHETNTQILKPSAYYFLSVYQLQELLEGKHPKLAVKHPSRPASTLSPADIRDYTLMYQYRITSVLDFIRGFCHRYTSNPKCGEVEVCGRQFAHLVGRLHRSWQPKTGALYFIHQVIGEARSTASICSLCRSDFVSKAEQLRLELWDHLPSVIGLPSWSELQERDLAV